MHVHFSIVLALVVTAMWAEATLDHSLTLTNSSAPEPDAVLATILDPQPTVTSTSNTEVHGLHLSSAAHHDAGTQQPPLRRDDDPTPRDVVIKKRQSRIVAEEEVRDPYERRKRNLKISFACALAAISLFYIWLLTAAVKQAIRQPNTKKAIQTYQEAIATMKQERMQAAAADESS